MRLTVERIDRYPVEVPARDVPGRNMARELPHWRYLEVVEVELGDGAVGHCETTLFYTWGETTDEDLDRAVGSNAADLMWDDTLGAGLQIALFDAVGHSLGVPVHALLGEKVREETPVSWWCIDMPAEDLVAEAERAIELGYTNLKVKGRSWFDIRAQLEALDKAVPEWLGIEVDFNGTLLDADRGLPLLEELGAFPHVSLVEGPLPQDDLEGNARLTEVLDLPVALHYGTPDPTIALREQVCDGFVASGGRAACGTWQLSRRWPTDRSGCSSSGPGSLRPSSCTVAGPSSERRGRRSTVTTCSNTISWSTRSSSSPAPPRFPTRPASATRSTWTQSSGSAVKNHKSGPTPRD